MSYDSRMANGGKVAVVTGGAGFIGSHLVDELIRRGYEVRVVDNLVAGKREHVHPDAKFHQVDIRDEEALRPIVDGATYVFHLAALPRIQFSIDFPHESNSVNIAGTLKVLHAAKEGGVRKFIYSASGSVYGNQETLPLHEGLPTDPVSPYALQKYVGEEYVRLYADIHRLSGVSLRYFNVYGPRMNFDGGAYTLVIAAFLKEKKNGQPLQITGRGDQTRDFTHVRDVVRANILAAESGIAASGERINIGAGRNVSINELAKLIGGSVEFVAARKENIHSQADNRRAKELLGWEPEIRLEEGIAELLREEGF